MNYSLDLSPWPELAESIRGSAWDLAENWLKEAGIELAADRRPFSRQPAGDLFGSELVPSTAQPDHDELLANVPTLVGGIARVVSNIAFLEDLEPGGYLYGEAKEFGRMRHDTGFPFDRLPADFSLLRQKLWAFVERGAPEPEVLFELNRRINLAIDRMGQVAMEAYHHHHSVDLLELSHHDRLTGLLNLKTFVRRIDSEALRAERYRYDLTLIKLDIDGFTGFNQQSGRLAGNEVLKDLAKTVVNSSRATDISSRTGPDEFSLLLPHTSSTEALTAAERLRQEGRHLGARHGLVTVSIGVVSFPDHGRARQDLLILGDECLSRAKAQGGDVVISGQSEERPFNKLGA